MTVQWVRLDFIGRLNETAVIAAVPDEEAVVSEWDRAWERSREDLARWKSQTWTEADEVADVAVAS